MTHRAAGAWVGVHLFLETRREEVAATGDRVLREVVVPLVRDLAAAGVLRRWFYIRYAEGGPHLRLRLQPRSDEHRREIDEAVARHALLDPEQSGEADAGNDAGNEAGHEAPQDAGHDAGPAAGPAAGTVRPSRHAALRHACPAPYRPETWRYGGELGVEVAEDLFHLCSEVAVEVLAAPGSDQQASPAPVLSPQARSAQALLVLTVLLHAFCRDRETAVEQADAYSREWVASMDPGSAEPLAHQRAWRRAFDLNCERQPPALGAAVVGLWSALEAGDVPEPLGRLHHGSLHLRRRLEELTAAGGIADPDGPLGEWRDVRRLLVPSYLHMMSNRLGISTFQEAFTGRMLARFLAPAAVFPPTREGGSNAQEDRAESG